MHTDCGICNSLTRIDKHCPVCGAYHVPELYRVNKCNHMNRAGLPLARVFYQAKVSRLPAPHQVRLLCVRIQRPGRIVR